MATSYSDLEVATKHRTQPGLEFDHRSEPHNYKEAVPVHQQLLEPPSKPERKLCGLSPKSFWIFVVLIVLIVVAGAVGGGVGGSQASKAKSPKSEDSGRTSSTSTTQSQSTTSLSSSSSSSAASTTTAPSISTTQIIGPKYTLSRDCPSSNNTLFTDSTTSGGGSVGNTFRKLCGMSFVNTLQSSSVGNVVNTKTSSLDSCIGLCIDYNVANGTAIAAGTNSACNAVCWRNSLDADDFPGQCFGFTTLNSTSGFVAREEGKCDSAAAIYQTFV